MHRFPQPESLALLAAREQALLSAFDTVLARKAWSRQEIRTEQWRTLRALVEHAFTTVPMYREKYSACGFHPSQLGSLDDLAQIPVLSKEDLRRASGEALRSSVAGPPARLLASSGSTGVPSRMWRDESSLWNFTAQNMAFYFDWCGGQPIESHRISSPTPNSEEL